MRTIKNSEMSKICNHSFLRTILVLSVMLFFLSACTAYYNTFYNAEKYFEEGQALEIGANGKPSSQAVNKYNECIKRCGVVLTDYPKSKYIDDAIFLLGKATFYKQMNYLKAIENFEDLYQFYPDSKYVPESRFYLAKSYFIMNKKTEAYNVLNDFLLNPEWENLHSECLYLLAELNLQEKQYGRTSYFLQQILDNHKKSKEYQTSFFLLGKVYHNQNEYQKSNEVFFELLDSRVDRNLKMDARMYIAKNYLMLEEYDEAMKTISKLLRKEYRPKVIPWLELIKARVLANTNQTEKAEELFLLIRENNKTEKELTSEAAFYLAEMYFKTLLDYENAILNYNLVKSEFKESPFIETAVSRSSVASKILQINDKKREITIEELVNEQFKLAEYYIDYLSLPDSAIAVYDNVEKYYYTLKTKYDSLSISYAREIADSLKNSTHSANEPDSISNDFSDSSETGIFPINQDSLLFILPNSTQDSTAFNQDINEETYATKDSLKQEITTLDNSAYTGAEIESAPEFSFPEINTAEKTEKNPLIAGKENVEKDSVQNSTVVPDSATTENTAARLKDMKSNLEKYENEFIPFTLFVKTWIYKEVVKDSLKAQKTYELLSLRYPDHKYTDVTGKLLNNEEIKTLDYEKDNLLLQYQKIIDYAEINPDSAVKNLMAFNPKNYEEIQDKVNYSLGYIYYFSLADSTSAKPFFDGLLLKNPDSPYAKEIKKYYHDNHFIKIDRLPSIEVLIARELEEKEALNEKSENEEEVIELKITDSEEDSENSDQNGDTNTETDSDPEKNQTEPQQDNDPQNPAGDESTEATNPTDN